MNKKQLIDALEEFPDTIEILVSADSEGNSYSSLEFVDQQLALKDYSGGKTEEIFSKEDVADDHDDSDPILDSFKEVLVLWP